MTAFAYSRAATFPALKALEISVCQSSDGVLVCSHDPTTTRVTGVPYTIADETWATLSELRVRSDKTTDPNQPARPFTRLEEVLEAYASDFVLFVEPKVDAATEPVMAALAKLQQPERVVWKQWAPSPHFGAAKAKGFSTWAYVLNEPAHIGANLSRWIGSPDVDLVGAPRDQSDEFVQAIVGAAEAVDKITIMWNIRNVEDRERALRLGCRGMMTSNIAELLTP